MSLNKNIATSGANQNNIGIEVTFIKIISQGISWISNATKVAIFGRSLPSSNINLWIEAYALAQQHESDLMKSYLAHLHMRIDNLLAIDKDLLNPQYVEHVVKKLLEIRESFNIQVWVPNGNNQIQEQIDKPAGFLIGSNSIIKSAEPHVALAWSAVSIFLSLVAKSPKYDEAMLKGFNIISDMQIFWKSFGETYLATLELQLQQKLKSALIELYFSIVKYQAEAVHHLSKLQSSHILEHLAESQNWTEMTKLIQSLEESCLSCITETQHAETQRNSKLLLDETRRLRNTQEEIRDIIKEGQQDEKERGLLNELANVSKSYEEEKNRNPMRVPGTCEWFLVDERFCKWRDSRSGGILWVSADPGCGKSVLSRTLIDEGHLTSGTTITIESSSITTSRENTVVCYFFFKEGGESQMNITQALCAILHQLFTCKSTAQLIAHALSGHKNNGETLSKKVNDLWRIFIECAKSSPVPIICIIDALDECKGDGQMELINKLCEQSSQDGAFMPSKLKFLITSRPYNQLKISFNRLATSSVYLHFDGDDKSGQISQEINLVIDEKVNQIASGLWETACDEISKHLKSMNNRTYLWLYLILSIIEGDISNYSRSKDMKKFLSTLPLAVSDAYEKILPKSEGEDKEQVQKVQKVEALLQIILAATRPLTLVEANYALTLTLSRGEYSSHKELQEDLWSHDIFKATSRDLCGLFISIHDSKLSFIHQTAREFLTHSEKSGEWKGRLDLSKSHGVLSGACISYLKMLDTPFKQGDPFKLEYPFFFCAANSWPLHFRLQDAGSTEAHRKHARELCCASAVQTRNWTQGFNSEIFQVGAWPDIYIAAYFGLTAVAQDIIVLDHVDINAEGGVLNRTPIHTAIRQGHLEIMQTLLESHSEAEVSVGDIIAAVKNSSKAAAMAELLLKKRSNDNNITIEVLKYAGGNAQNGAATIGLLLEKHPDKIEFSECVMEVTAQFGSVETMSLILKNRGHEIVITEDIVKVAAGNCEHGLEIVALFLKARSDEIKITPVIVKAAAGNCRLGLRIITLLLDERGHEFKITEDIVKVAARNLYQGLEIVALLLDKRSDQINVTKQMIKSIEPEGKNDWGAAKRYEIIDLLRQRCDHRGIDTDKII